MIKNKTLHIKFIFKTFKIIENILKEFQVHNNLFYKTLENNF